MPKTSLVLIYVIDFILACSSFVLMSKTYIMFEGKILKEGIPENLANDPQVRQAYLGENFRFEKI